MPLIRERLRNIVGGKSVCLREKEERFKWEEQSPSATALIFLHPDDMAERQVRDFRDPVVIWTKLKEVY
jgi:hypothetical protein